MPGVRSKPGPVHRPVAQTRRVMVMNFILMVTAALFAIVSVAAADELPRKKPRSPTTAAPSQKVRDATRPVPVRRGGLQQRNDGRVPPTSARQSDRPAAQGAATNSNNMARAAALLSAMRSRQ